MRHANGAYCWFQVRASVRTRNVDGSPARMLRIATDVTASNTARTLARTRVIHLDEIPDRLRRFREQLNMTQAQFGQAFGGLDQKQIGNYERGDAEPSLKLLVAIHNAGHPLEVVLGSSHTPLLDETFAYLALQQSTRLIEVRLVEALLGLLRGEQDQMERIITELGIPTKVLSTKERYLLDQLTDTTTPKG